jgi:hypothetical protein
LLQKPLRTPIGSASYTYHWVNTVELLRKT